MVPNPKRLLATIINSLRGSDAQGDDQTSSKDNAKDSSQRIFVVRECADSIQELEGKLEPPEPFLILHIKCNASKRLYNSFGRLENVQFSLSGLEECLARKPTNFWTLPTLDWTAVALRCSCGRL